MSSFRCGAILTLLSTVLLAQPSDPEMRRLPPPMRKQAEEWNRKMGRGEGRLKPGDLAPDFELRRQGSPGTILLSRFRGQKPVALIFASYT